jgi:hypothetical protein
MESRRTSVQRRASRVQFCLMALLLAGCARSQRPPELAGTWAVRPGVVMTLGKSGEISLGGLPPGRPAGPGSPDFLGEVNEKARWEVADGKLRITTAAGGGERKRDFSYTLKPGGRILEIAGGSAGVPGASTWNFARQ